MTIRTRRVAATRARALVPALLLLTVLIAGCDRGGDAAGSPELWPAGTSDDIATLRDRDDVNVLFILIDTLRADRLSAYGYERDTSPTLADVTRFGVRFDRHLAQSSWTKSSMASMWTGFNPTRTGVLQFDSVIPGEAVMPAEVFSANGFRTIGVFRNGWVAPTFGFDQGFDVYTRPPRLPMDREVFLANPTVEFRGNDLDVTRSAIEFMRANRNDRFFLYVHLMDVHEYTYDEQSALFGTTYSDIYDNSIRWTDDSLAEIFGQMLEWGLFKNTVIVIGSDHGEAFRERGHEGHAKYLYREETEVPFIIVFPFRLEEGGAVVDSRSRNVDIWPTVYDLLDLDVPPSEPAPDGVSLVPEILSAATHLPLESERADAAAAREGFAHLSQNWGRGDSGKRTYALTHGSERYVRFETPGGLREELLDSDADPFALADVAAARPDAVARMRERADRLAVEAPVWGEPETRELTELELNQLRALGYKVQ